MNIKVFFFAVLIISVVSVSAFAGVSIDLGVSALGNAVFVASRPAGATVALGVTLFDYRAIVQIAGTFLVPPLGDDYNDPAGVISAGVLFSPMEYLYLGMRTNMITPPDTVEDWSSYGTIVIRVQKPGKGFHFFAESETSFIGALNRFSAGLNLTL